MTLNLQSLQKVYDNGYKAVNGIDLLRRFRDFQPRIYPVIMTANISVETAARACDSPGERFAFKASTICSATSLSTDNTSLKSRS